MFASEESHGFYFEVRIDAVTTGSSHKPRDVDMLACMQSVILPARLAYAAGRQKLLLSGWLLSLEVIVLSGGSIRSCPEHLSLNLCHGLELFAV